MTSYEKLVARTQNYFQEFADKGKEWISLEELALKATIERRAARRAQRSRLANSIVDMFSDNGGRPKKASAGIRRETELALFQLKTDGTIEHRFVNSAGQLLKNPTGRLDYRNCRYRLVPETKQGSEASVRDRFESVGRRIAALPEAIRKPDQAGEEITVASSVFGVIRGSLPTVQLDFRV